jgi:hypothetical protein
MRFGTFGVGERLASVSRFGLILYTDPAIRAPYGFAVLTHRYGLFSVCLLTSDSKLLC